MPAACERRHPAIGAATEQLGALIRIRLTSETDASIDSSNVRLSGPICEASRPVGSIAFAQAQRYVDVKIDSDRAPFLILPEINSLRIVIYRSAVDSH